MAWDYKLSCEVAEALEEAFKILVVEFPELLDIRGTQEADTILLGSPVFAAIFLAIFNGRQV